MEAVPRYFQQQHADIVSSIISFLAWDQCQNRLSSGSCFQPPVRRVDIPKDDGRTRPLGISICPSAYQRQR
jgi:hypothetical protein